MSGIGKGTVASWVALVCGALAFGIAAFAEFAFLFVTYRITTAGVWGLIALVYATPPLILTAGVSGLIGLIRSRKAGNRRAAVLSVVGLVCALLTLAFIVYLQLSSHI